jgi:hypothetical protein
MVSNAAHKDCIAMTLKTRLVVATAIALVTGSNTAAFSTPRCVSVYHPHKRRSFSFDAPLLESPSDQNQPRNDIPAKGERTQKYSTSRVGGRRAKKQKSKNEDTTKTNDGLLFGIMRQIAIPIVLATLFLRLLSGNLFGGSNVVYYSSTVYQSTTYSRDGNIETKRRESFKSNVPGLVERARERSQGNNGNIATRGSYYDLNSEIEDELMDVEDEINSIFGKW